MKIGDLEKSEKKSIRDKNKTRDTWQYTPLSILLIKNEKLITINGGTFEKKLRGQREKTTE
jgi:hypothetical protein